MFCPACGTQLPDDSVFCFDCGQGTKPVAAATAQGPAHHAAAAPTHAPIHATPATPAPVAAASPPAPASHAPAAAPSPVAPRAFCHACGGPVDLSSRFCHSCGAEVVAPPSGAVVPCPICGLQNPTDRRVCSRCRGVMGLPRDFQIRGDDYEFAGDRQGLAALKATPGIAHVADYISRKLGKPYIEGQFIGGAIRVSDEQFPQIHRLASYAATVLCLPQLPQMYVSGDRGWASETHGTATDAFVVLGTYLTRQLTEAELLFIIAHELGHIKSGHAMYRTVAEILAGSSGGANVMGGGIFALLDVKRLITLPIELKLLQWVRQSEITADAAGLAVVGDLEIANKVLMIMSLRSADMYRQINLEAYLRQQEELDQNIVKLSEYVSQSTPYVATRVKLMREYAGSQNFHALRARIAGSRDLAETCATIERLKAPEPPASTPVDDTNLRGTCPHCQAPYKVARDKIPEGQKVHLRCKQCKKTFPVAPEEADD